MNNQVEEECTCKLLNKCKVHPRREEFVIAVREYADRIRSERKKEEEKGKRVQEYLKSRSKRVGH